MLFCQAAVLHDLNGNRDRAILQMKDWLDALSGTDHAAWAKALAQLEKLNAG